jgi:hypothetical protein
MKTHHKNPHTFDMSNYYSGMTYMIGGRDFDREEKDLLKNETKIRTDKENPKELDWSFLKSFANKRKVN